MIPRRSTGWDRWISLLLRFYPKRFRVRFGEDLAAQYATRPEESLLRAGLDAGRDLSRGGLGARLDDLRAAWSTRGHAGGLDGLRVDLRHTFRGLARRPLFAFSVTATLALAAGLNASVFGILDTTLLRPLPVRDEGTIVSIGSQWVGFEHSAVSIPEYLDYVERSRTLGSIAAFTGASFNLSADRGSPERVLGARVTASFFEVLGVQPVLGRVFTTAEDRPGSSNVVVLSHGFWQRQFGGHEAVIGQTVSLDSGAREIIGVMPPDFRFPVAETDLWIPLLINTAALPSRGSHNRQVIARIAPDTSMARVREEMRSIAHQLAVEHPSMYPAGSGWDISIRPLREHLVGTFRNALRMLMAAVAFVLLIACVNVANLMVARATEREHELATRTALGASRFRLARQMLVEGLMLGMAGGAIGLACGSALLRALTSLLPEGLPVPAWLMTDLRVAGFTIALTALAGGAAAFATTLRTITPARALRAIRSSADAASQRLRSVLTIAEIALAVMLLVASGVALRSFARLVQVDPGHAIDDIATARVTAVTHYAEASDLARYFERIATAVANQPVVRHAGLVSNLPLSGSISDWGFGVEGYVPPTPGVLPDEQMRMVGGDYFTAMGIRLVSGRLFDSHDDLQSPRVAIVSELVARKYWAGVNPVGRRIRFFGLDSAEPWTTVVGIVSDVRHHGLDSDFIPIVYAPVAQIPERSLTVVARFQPGARLGPSVIADAVRTVDPQQPVFAGRMMDDWLARSVAAPRFNMTLLGLFAIMAVALAAVGVYGVMAFTVTRRTRELGIRLALGARPTTLLRLILERSFFLTAVGVALGLAAGLAAAATLGTMFHEAQILDPVVIAGVSLLVPGVALVASYLPARRAMRVDPVEALRAE